MQSTDRTQYRILKIRDCESDGSPAYHPDPRCFESDDDYMRERLAQCWAAERHDIPKGTKVILDRLPTGYVAYKKARVKDPERIDRYFYGHRNGAFMSVRRFYAHFKHMMDHGTCTGCPCMKCGEQQQAQQATRRTHDPMRSIEPVQPATRDNSTDGFMSSRHETRQLTTSPRHLSTALTWPSPFATITAEIIKLPSDASLDRPLDDLTLPWPFSDGKLTTMSSTFDLLKTLPAHLHRPGEVILFVPCDVYFDNTANAWFELNADAQRSDVSPVVWAAGLVVYTDTEHDSETNTVVSVRELTADGGLGEQQTVMLRRTLPWRQRMFAMLKHTEAYPTSIQAALACTASLSAFLPLRVRATFANGQRDAIINCCGLYLGHELVVLGDMVTLVNELHGGARNTPDMLEITQIKLHLTDFEPGTCKVCAHLTGRPFTEHPHKSYGGYGKSPVVASEGAGRRPTKEGMPLYHVLDPLQPRLRFRVPFTRVIGRQEGPQAVQSMVNGIHPAHSEDMFSQRMSLDDRSQRDEARAARWSDSRAMQLGLSEQVAL